MPFCSKCGGWYADEDLVCSTCGCTVSPSVQSTQPEDPYLSSIPQPTAIPPVQTAWDPFSQPAWDAPAQPAWEAPVPPAWDAPAQPTIETPGQPAWKNPAQPAWDPFPQPAAPESPAQSAKTESGQPKTAFLLGIIATLALLLVLLIGVFAADYFTDREVNLFGLLGQEDDREPSPMDSSTTAPGEETVPPMPTEPMPTISESKPAETQPIEPVPTVTEPPETLPEDGDSVLLAVMENKRQLRTESGSMMYLTEFLAMYHGSEVDRWEFLDFDQDGENEVFAIADSEVASYLVIHWNGTDPCCFPFGYRSISELKTNGYMSGSNGAAHTVYYRIDFQGDSVTSYTLADFDTDEMRFEIDGRKVTEEEANAFLREWYFIPNVLGSSYYPPEEEPAAQECAYCGDSLGSGELDNAYGMCDSCLQNGGKCSVCGKLTGYLDGGKCSSCQKPVNTADCAYCGVETDVQLLTNGLCEECWYWRGVGWCSVCGQLSDNLFEGVCEICEPWGGRGEPEECCVHCGKPSYDLVTGICNDCYWYVGWCSVCGNLAYEIYDGVCTDCAPRDDGEDPEEYMSQCTVCGEWSDTVFEGICDNCGGYNGMG